MTWREKARAEIAHVMRQNPGVVGEPLRKLLRAHGHLFHGGAHWVYLMWREETNEVCGTPGGLVGARRKFHEGNMYLARANEGLPGTGDFMQRNASRCFHDALAIAGYRPTC